MRQLGKFPVAGFISIKTLSDQVNWFSQNMGFGKDIMTKKILNAKNRVRGLSNEKISHLSCFFCSESLPQAIKITSLVKKTTWPYVKVVQFVSGDIIRIGF